MHSSTALASSGLMLRMLSSAFGDFFVKLSQASYRMAEGDVDPGLNIDNVEAEENTQKMNPRKPTRNGTENRGIPGTFCIKSQTSSPSTRTPSISVIATVEPE
jgi:hypothetical protein